VGVHSLTEETSRPASGLRDGSPKTVDTAVGDMHKMRSFFNNISDPLNAESVTVGTRAIAAAFLHPMGGSDPAVITR
jgi:hypothetical protein